MTEKAVTMRKDLSVGRMPSICGRTHRTQASHGAAGRSIPDETHLTATDRKVVTLAAGEIGGATSKPSPAQDRRSVPSSRATSSQAGFTLVEVLVVLSIIGLVVGLIGPRVVGYLNDAKLTTARIQATTLSNAIELFFIDNGRYPLETEGLQALIAPPGSLQTWNGPYLKAAAVPRDPWGKPYQYAVQGDGRSFLISFMGDRRGKGEETEVNRRYSATRGGAIP